MRLNVKGLHVKIDDVVSVQMIIEIRILSNVSANEELSGITAPTVVGRQHVRCRRFAKASRPTVTYPCVL